MVWLPTFIIWAPGTWGLTLFLFWGVDPGNVLPCLLLLPFLYGHVIVVQTFSIPLYFLLRTPLCVEQHCASAGDSSEYHLQCHRHSCRCLPQCSLQILGGSSNILVEGSQHPNHDFSIFNSYSKVRQLFVEYHNHLALTDLPSSPLNFWLWAVW